jgi:hypothetical protein
MVNLVLTSSTKRGVDMDNEVIIITTPPKIDLQRYKLMCTYGSHFQCENAKRCVINVNCGVAKTLPKLCSASLKDTTPIDANIKYVGCKVEALKLNLVDSKP